MTFCWSPCLAYSSHYCQQLTLSVCLSVRMSVCLSRCFRLLFFVSRWNRAIFWHSVLHMPLYKTVFFDFWFRPPNAQNLLRQICTKSPISRFVWQIDRRCFGITGGFRGRPIQWINAKCCGPTLVAMATKFGLGAEIQSPTGLFCTSFGWRQTAIQSWSVNCQSYHHWMYHQPAAELFNYRSVSILHLESIF